MARDGDLTTRAQALTAYQIRVLRLALDGLDPRSEESIEEEIGAILFAEPGLDTHALRKMYEAVHK